MVIYVQFKDESEAEIVSVFCGPQDPEVHSNQGVVDEDDPRYLAFKEAMSLR